MKKSDRQLIDLHVRRGETQTAVRLAADLAQASGNDPEFWSRLAVIQAEVENYQDAWSALERADRILADVSSAAGGPLPVGIFNRLEWGIEKTRAEILQGLARGDASYLPALLESLRRLTGLDPNDDRRDVGSTHSLIHALMCAGRFDEAERELGTAEYAMKTALFSGTLTYPKIVRWLATFRRDPMLDITPFPPDRGDRFVIVMTVWGDDFLDSLEAFTLPSLLSAGNLPYLAQAGDVRFVFFTSENGARRLERMPAFIAARQLVTCDVILFPNELTTFPETYKLMSTMHVAAMEIARASRSHFYFLAPDVIAADNFLEALDRRRRQGHEIVFVPGLMLELESFAAEQTRAFPAVNGVVSISASDLLKLGLRHLHRLTRNHYLADSEFLTTASVLLWPLCGDGFLAHGFHHSPFLISAEALQRSDGSMFQTIDGEFLTKVIHSRADLDRCLLIDDARETCYFELSRRHRPYSTSRWGIPRIARWGMIQGITARWLFRQLVRFDPQPPNPDDPASHRAREFADAVLREMDDLEQRGFPLGRATPVSGAAGRSEP